MKCQCLFRHITKSEALSRHAEERTVRDILGTFDGLAYARAIFSRNGNEIEVRYCLYGQEGLKLLVYESGTDAYAVFDRAIEKTRHQLERREKKRLSALRNLRRRQRHLAWEPLPLAS